MIEAHGPSAVGVFFGSGNGMDASGYRMSQALHAALGTPAKFSPLTIDGTAKVLISDLVGGSVALSGRPDYDHATFVVFFGSNPVVSHGHSVAMPDPVSAIRELATRAEVWVVDPRRTETARLAGHHLAPRPGTDYAVLAFLVREVLRDGGDPAVLAPRVSGVEELAAAVEPFTLEHAARVADVATTDLQQLLAGVRRAGPRGHRHRDRRHHGRQRKRHPVAGVGVDGADRLDEPPRRLLVPPGVRAPAGGVRAARVTARRFVRAGPEQPIRTRTPSSASGPARCSPTRSTPAISAPCSTSAGHLLTAFPDANTLEPALRELDVFATIEIIANDTTAISTHVLPTKDQLERADVTLWDFLSPRVAAQHTPAIVDPVGDRRSTWWVLAELGRRLGYDLADTRDQQLTDDVMLATISKRGRRPFEQLVADGWVEVDHDLPAPWVDQHVARLGGWRLAPRLLVDQLAGLDHPDARRARAAPADPPPELAVRLPRRAGRGDGASA